MEQHKRLPLNERLEFWTKMFELKAVRSWVENEVDRVLYELRKERYMKTNQMFPSDYLTKEAIPEEGINLTIKLVLKQPVFNSNTGLSDDKWVMSFVETEKTFVLSPEKVESVKVALDGLDDTDRWNGKVINIYVDPSIKFGKETRGGLRTRKATGEPIKSESLPF